MILGFAIWYFFGLVGCYISHRSVIYYEPWGNRYPHLGELIIYLLMATLGPIWLLHVINMEHYNNGD